MPDRRDTVEVEIDLLEHETEKAYLIIVDNEEFWLPKSQVEDINEDSVWIPCWLAEEKGLEHNG